MRTSNLILALVFVSGLTADSVLAGDLVLLVSSYWADKVVKVDAVSGAGLGDAIPPGSGGLHFPEGLLAGSENVLYVSSVGFDRPSAIKKYDLTSGAYLGDLASGGHLLSPRGLARGPDGQLYVCNDGSDEVLRYDLHTGTFIDAFVGAGAGGMSEPQDLEFRGDYLYVSNHGTDTVLRFEASNGAYVDVFASHPSMSNPHGMTFGPEGDLYVVSSANDSVLRFDGQTGAFVSVFVPPGLGGLMEPDGVLFGPQGDLYVTGYSSHAVHRYDGVTGQFKGVLASVPDPTYMLIVPEPCTLALLGLGGLALGRRRSARRGGRACAAHGQVLRERSRSRLVGRTHSRLAAQRKAGGGF